MTKKKNKKQQSNTSVTLESRHGIFERGDRKKKREEGRAEERTFKSWVRTIRS